MRAAWPAAVLLALGLAVRPVGAQATDTAALAGGRAAVSARQLVLPATLGSAAGLLAGFFAGQSLGWGGGDDPGLTGAIVGAGVGSAAGTAVGLLAAGRGAITPSAAIPAATLGVAAGLGTVLLLGAVANLEPGGFLIAYSVGQGFFAGMVAAGLQTSRARDPGHRE